MSERTWSIFGFPAVLILIVLGMAWDFTRSRPQPDDRDDRWTLLPPPVGSPYAGCAIRYKVGVVCWLPPQSPTCTSPDGVELP